MKILFVCSNNKDRSKTAEDIYKNDPRFEVRSAGVNVGATQVVTKELVNWADVIVVMNEKEDRQEFKLHQNFPYLRPLKKKIIDFDIPNRFARGDPLLVAMIKEKVEKGIFKKLYKTTQLR